MRCLWWAIALAACGDVQKVPDAAVPDAYQPDPPQEVTCGSGEMSCNGVCTNPMTDELYCGNCNTQCSPTQACVNATCVPANTSCSRVREIDPTAADGAYLNPNTGDAFYCDFTNNVTYDSFAMGAFNGSYPGYTMMSSANFNDPLIQKAFIGIYNEQGGATNLMAGAQGGNCCFKAADTGAGQMLLIGGHHIYPARVDADVNVCGGPYTASRYRFFLAEEGPFSPFPMPADYFTTYPASVAARCSDSAPQPAFFMKKHAGLN